MVQTDYKRLRAMAFAFAKYKGMRDEPLCEDFAQEYCLAIFEGKPRSLEKQFCNFCRKYFGRNDKYALKKHLAKSQGFKHTIPLYHAEKYLIHDDETLSKLIRAQEIERFHACFKDHYLEGLVIKLTLKGCDQEDIALRLGLNRSRVSLLYTQACERLRKKFGKESDRDT